MNTLKVVAMLTGWLTVDRSSQVYGRYFGQQIKVPVWSTAIVGAAKKIVVDTGIHDPAWVSNFVCPCEQAPEQRLEQALKEYVGWSADDVDIVINTHLHYDHSGGNTLFRNARFVIQTTEWEYAGRPLPTQATYYQEFLWPRATRVFSLALRERRRRHRARGPCRPNTGPYARSSVGRGQYRRWRRDDCWRLR